MRRTSRCYRRCISFLLLVLFVSCFSIFLNLGAINFCLDVTSTLSCSQNRAGVPLLNSDISEAMLGNDFEGNFEVLRSVGRDWTGIRDLENLLESSKENSTARAILIGMRAKVDNIEKIGSKRYVTTRKNLPRVNITVAIVACGSASKDAIVMLKSVVLFSQDANLHVIIFGDRETLLDFSQSVLELKWSVNALGWDFTYELHLEWFPSDSASTWRNMYAVCATQRLFFPSRLPHIDALIYLDTDILVVSNLTELWLELSEVMGEDWMAGLAPNNEETAEGWYNGGRSEIPYYGKTGLNAGVMLMNLTQMRSFNLEARAMAAYTLYQENIGLADQDILNIIFHAYPGKLHLLDCTYNFNWVHCGFEHYRCHDPITGDSICFCNATFGYGVQIVHGNMYTFHRDGVLPFLTQLYSQFEKFNILSESPMKLFQNLSEHFKTLTRPCHPLTAQMLYGNAMSYFQSL